MPMHSESRSSGSSPACRGRKMGAVSNMRASALPRCRFIASVDSMDGTSEVRIWLVSSPRGLRIFTAFRRSSPALRPKFSIHLGLIKE